MVIRFQCPEVAQKEGAEIPTLPHSPPLSLLLPLFLSWAACPGASSVRVGEAEDWVAKSWTFTVGMVACLSDTIAVRGMWPVTVGVRRGQKCADS